MSATLAKDSEVKPFETKLTEEEIRVGELKYMKLAMVAVRMLAGLNKPNMVKYGKSLAAYIHEREPDNPQLGYIRLITDIAGQIGPLYQNDKQIKAMLEAEAQRQFMSQFIKDADDD